MGERRMGVSMGETLPTLVNQTASMFVMMAVGYLLFKLHMIDDGGVAQMSNVVLYVASPAVVLQSFVTEFSVEKLVGAAWCAALSALITLVAIGLTHAVYGSVRPISQMSVIFTNSGFIGIPLVQNVLGTEYVFYASICVAVVTVFLWTYGVFLVSHDRDEISAKKVLTNPGVVVLFVGLAMFVLSIGLPEILSASVASLGNVNGGLAMVVLGAYLAQADIVALGRDKWVYLASFLKLLVVPLVFVVILRLVPGLGLGVKLTLLITFATPSGGVTAMFSQKYGANYQYGVGLVSFSTLLSLASMPLVIGLALLVL